MSFWNELKRRKAIALVLGWALEVAPDGAGWLRGMIDSTLVKRFPDRSMPRN
jgi:hypothetical protein